MVKNEKKVFAEAIDGFGFVEVNQTGDGIYCTGCMRTHKKPTKMYTNKQVRGMETLCRFQVIRLYGPED